MAKVEERGRGIEETEEATAEMSASKIAIKPLISKLNKS